MAGPLVHGRDLVGLQRALDRVTCVRLCWPADPRWRQHPGPEAAVDMKAVRRRCEVAAAQITVPAPFDVRSFVERVAALRGRPIRLAAMSTGVASPCGLWIATESIDLIFYEDLTSPPHQRHIVVHEIGHLWFDHQTAASAEQADLAGHFPDLDPEVVRRVLARGTVTADEEREAEMFATVVLGSGWQRPEPALPHKPVAGDELERLRRLSTALDPVQE